MKNEIKYKDKIIQILYPSGMFKYYSDKDGKFLKFDSLKDAKKSIDSENEKISESRNKKSVKIRLNELRQIVKKLIKEEVDKKSEMIDIVSNLLTHEYTYYVVDGSYGYINSDGGDGSSMYEFSMLIPKGDELIDEYSKLNDVKNFFREMLGINYHSSQAGGRYSKSYVNVVEKGYNFLITITYESGYDV